MYEGYGMNTDQNINFKTRFGPDGLLLFNRTTGMNILLDEIKIPPELWAKSPRQVSIAITNKCDLNCSHCYAPKKKASLDFNLLKEWLHILDQNGCMGVGFGGGEPTMYPKFIELCKYTSNETNLAVTMTTHGHLLNVSLIEQLSSRINFIRISMDGIKSKYENYRGRSFDELLHKIELIKGVIPFGINYLVNSYTFSDLDEAVMIIEDLGANELLLLPEVPVGRGVQIDDSTTAAMQEWVYNYQGNVKLSISECQADGMPICEPFIIEKELFSYAHIDASGIIKKTSFDNEGIKIDETNIMKALSMLKNKEHRGYQ